MQILLKGWKIISKLLLWTRGDGHLVNWEVFQTIGRAVFSRWERSLGNNQSKVMCKAKGFLHIANFFQVTQLRVGQLGVLQLTK